MFSLFDGSESLDDDSDSVFNEVGDDATVVAAGVVETRVQRKHSTEDGVFVRTGHQKLVLLLVVFLEEAEEEEEEEGGGGGEGEVHTYPELYTAVAVLVFI